MELKSIKYLTDEIRISTYQPAKWKRYYHMEPFQFVPSPPRWHIINRTFWKEVEKVEKREEKK